MIVKLDKDRAFTEGMSDYIFCYSEDGFIFWPYRKEKLKFLGIKHYKNFYFLDMLELGTWVYWDVLRWNKKQ